MAGATELASLIVLYSLVSVGVAELSIRRVPVRAAASRVACRLTTLALPLLLPLVFQAVAPFRAEAWFEDLALFSTHRWQRLRVWGVGLRDLALVPTAALGAFLLLRDLLHPRHRPRRATPEAGDAELLARLSATVRDLAGRMAVRPPAVVLVDAPAAVLHCRGLRRPVVLASRSGVSRLGADELRGAIAHELAHVRGRDLLKTWFLVVLRCAQWFNPIAQVVARRTIQELEWHADDVAVATTGQSLALARALVRCARERDTEFLGLLGRRRIVSVEERCRRLMDPDPERLAKLASWQVAALAGTLVGLLFFVV